MVTATTPETITISRLTPVQRTGLAIYVFDPAVVDGSAADPDGDFTPFPGEWDGSASITVRREHVDGAIAALTDAANSADDDHGHHVRDGLTRLASAIRAATKETTP